MFAYAMAAAHENLPHLVMSHYVVSNTELLNGEGWKWVDTLVNQCQPPVISEARETAVYFPGKPLPNFLHYCRFFRAGELGFQKRRLVKNIFSCQQSLLLEPQANLSSLDYKNRDGQYIIVPKHQIKRHSFALCVLHRSLNFALFSFKTRQCKNKSNNLINANFEKVINVVLNQKW